MFPSPVSALNFNANWDYQESGGEDRDTLRLFQQRYNLGVGPALSYQPTPAITATAGVGYTRTQFNQGQGVTNVESIIPTSRLAVMNDIFLAQVSGSASKMTSEAASGTVSENTGRSWDASLGSTWVIPLVPSLRFNTSETTDTNNRIFQTLDQDSSTSTENKSMALDWDLLLAKFYYTYSENSFTDSSESVNESRSHFARFETGTSFWQNRFGFNFAQQLQKTNQDFTLGAEEDGAANIPLAGVTSSAVIDPLTMIDPFTLPPPVVVTLADNAPLRNGDFESVALSVPLDNLVLLSVNFTFEQQVNLLRLTLDPAKLIDSTQAAALQWDLYVRDPIETGWVLAAPAIPFTYDAGRRLFDLTVDRLEKEFMVVARNTTGASLDFTEIEAFSLSTENLTSTSTSSLTNVGMRMQLTKTLRASAALTLDHLDSDSGESISETDRQSTSGNLRWTPLPSVTPSLGFSETRETRTGELDKLNRSYSLAVATIPLPSMNVTFGATQGETYIGEEKTGTSRRYNLTTTARIYPDLNASWYLSSGENEVWSISEERFVTTVQFVSRFNLNARLRRALTADFTSNYQNREREADRTEQADGTLSLQYRPSSLLALRGSYRTSFLGPETEDVLTLGMSLALLRTYKARLDMTASHVEAERSSDSLGLEGSWNISKYLLMLYRGNLLFAEKYSYNFQTSLMLKF